MFRLSIFPRKCAMHGAWNLKIGALTCCVHLPTWVFGAYWPPYFYISPDGTPDRAIFKIGWTD